MLHARFNKYFLLICISFFFAHARAQYIIPADTINAPLQVIPNKDSLFKQRDTSGISRDSLQKLQDDLFKKAYQQNKSGVPTTNLPKNKKGKVDTAHYSPKKAALWALACPGLGQIYNKKYWKLPIVYGIMGTVIYFVAANGKKLKEFNGYIRNVYDSVPNPEPYDQLSLDEIESNRNTYRRNVQLASFGTMFAWGLSIVDAVVDAHLHSFDVSSNLSLKVKPQINSFDNKYYAGLTLNLAFK